MSVRVSSIKPTADLEKALETKTREKIQQEADEAMFERRALAVQKERAIAENELQNQIELSIREEQLIKQQGQNEKHRISRGRGGKEDLRSSRSRAYSDSSPGEVGGHSSCGGREGRK